MPNIFRSLTRRIFAAYKLTPTRSATRSTAALDDADNNNRSSSPVHSWYGVTNFRCRLNRPRIDFTAVTDTPTRSATSSTSPGVDAFNAHSLSSSVHSCLTTTRPHQTDHETPDQGTAHTVNSHTPRSRLTRLLCFSPHSSLHLLHRFYVAK